MKKFKDDHFDHLESDIEKIRVRHRQYISYSGDAGAKSVVDEMINNNLDECRNPESPGNKVHILFDERTGTIRTEDNGRGIPTYLLEKIFTSLNMGSNIYTKNKANLKAETLGQNGTGTLAICGLGERTELISYRGGSDEGNIFKRIVFEEGKKVLEEDGKCAETKHGMIVFYKPSKVLGKNTKIVWSKVRESLLNLQYLNKKKITITSEYIDLKGKSQSESYKIQEFEEILSRNNKESLVSPRTRLTIEDNNVIEVINDEKIKRFLSMDIAFVWTNSMTPYIDSFSNSNNTVDNGSHLDGVIEALCRFFQSTTKGMLSEKEKQTLDIKYDDIRMGLSIAVALRTNYEGLYTGQTKHKIDNNDVKKMITDLTMETLRTHFDKNPGQLKTLCGVVKLNAKVRREGDKVRGAVLKETMTNWSSFKMKNYEPCTNKGKEYKELYIIEGDSAKGSLKIARDPRFQALFAIRGVSANVFKRDLNYIINENEEFKNLIKVMGCNVGTKFDLSKLQFDKIIIASDADVDGLGIRSLLCSFFIKLFPEIIENGRLFIAEPPLYRVADKKNPFVINKEDYVNRYIESVMKEYRVGTRITDALGPDMHDIKFLNKAELKEFLYNTSSYVDDMDQLSQHYKVRDRLIEIAIEEIASMYFDKTKPLSDVVKEVNLDQLMVRIGTEFPELWYDEKDQLIKGSVDGRYQLFELSESLIRKTLPLIEIMEAYGPTEDEPLMLKSVKTATEQSLSMLGLLKILRKFQPDIEHRFKGLGENKPEDIKTTIMDPNTRSLIRVQIGDIENDMKVFQTLRGTSPQDAQARKAMMRSYKIPRDLIDT